MPLIFSYGSLQQPAVQLSTFGRSLDGRKDALPGHATTTVVVNGRACANAVPAAADTDLEGTAFELTDDELARADGYEAPDGYARLEITLRSGRRASVYVHFGTSRR